MAAQMAATVKIDVSFADGSFEIYFNSSVAQVVGAKDVGSAEAVVRAVLLNYALPEEQRACLAAELQGHRIKPVSQEQAEASRRKARAAFDGAMASYSHAVDAGNASSKRGAKKDPSTDSCVVS